MSQPVRLLLRAGLLACPPSMRRRHGAEIVATVLARLDATRRRDGRTAAAVLLVRELAGLVACGAVARRRPPPAVRTAAPAAAGTLATPSPGVDAGPRRAPRFASRSLPRGGHAMSPALHLRHALRSLRRHPAPALVAVVTIGLALGANVAIFAVVEQVFLEPLPFAEPERLVAVWEENPERGWHQAQVAAANYLDWRERSELFADLAAYGDWTVERGMVAGGEPTPVNANQVTGNYLSLLGVPPLHGRVFDDRHTWAGAPPAVVLAHGFWQRQLGGDPAVVGRTMVLDDVAHTVLGVMPQGFAYPFPDVDAWLPVAWPAESREQVWFRRAHGMGVVGRLRDGVSHAAAAAEIQAIAAQLEAEYPETNAAMGAGLTPLREWMVGDQQRPLGILAAAVAMVLLVACANVANMLLARATRRRHELAVYRALGADGRALVVQELVQSLLIALAGGVLGLGLARLALPALAALRPPELARLELERLALDLPVVLFALGLAVLAGLVFGLLPAWAGARAAAAESVARGPRGASASPRSGRTAAGVVALQVALTLPLLVGAGLMVRSLVELHDVDPGFAPEGALVARLTLPTSRYAEDPQVSAFYRHALEAVRAVPGVRDAALSSRLPFGNQRWSSDFTIEGGISGQEVRHDEVSPGLFRTLGTPLVAGRDFTPDDDLDSEPVVIVNRALVERYFAGEDPIGRRVTFDAPPGEGSIWRTVVGVVEDVRRETLARREEPSFYAPILQDTTRGAHLVVRTDGDPTAHLAAVRARLAELDPALPLADVTTLSEVVARSLARERFLLVLLAAFALLALTLAAVGIYGVVAYAAALRRREVGIRLALGATRRQVFRHVLGRSMAPVVVGLVAGVVAALGLARGLAGLLYGVGPADPATFVAVTLLTLATALLACGLPTRGASRTDPVTVLRAE